MSPARKRSMPRALSIAALACLLAALPGTAAAQSAPDAWKFRAIIYGYFPSIGGTTTFPENIGGGTGSTQVDANTLLDNLDFAFMGTFEATRGRWGILACEEADEAGAAGPWMARALAAAPAKLGMRIGTR